MYTRSRIFLVQQGVTLVELVLFIVIVSVGVVGLVSVMNPMVRHSADPMLRKQMLTIAESLLTEALQQPFTLCDPDDAQASTALTVADCTNSQDRGGAALSGPTPNGETRSGDPAFDNVADYGGLSLSNVSDVNGSNVMNDYGASVAVERVGAVFGVAADAALRVTVTVTHPGSDSVSLAGYRFRYAPRN